jgi:hypothetical protein
MPFSEAVKLEVKRRAAFQCCRCREIGVDIHHIVPQAQDGSDDIDNAAPLCQNCHAQFGANPEKRKEIRQMRDWWYDVVREKYSTGDQSQFEKLNELILESQRAQTGKIDDLRRELIEAVNAIRAVQEHAVEDLKRVRVADIPRQANAAISTVMGMPETLRRTAKQEQK